MRVLYLHGFASSPGSRKAQFFSDRLQQLGFSVEVPDLAGGDFEHLALSKQLALVERLAGTELVILIGSSMGGYLAALYAARHSAQVDRLILLAPAFDFQQLWCAQLGPERLRAWQEQGVLPVFHYGVGRDVPLAYEMLEDAARFEAFPTFSQPCLIFHGVNDTVVPVQKSIEFAASHPNVDLIKLPSGHELTDVLDDMWSTSKDFVLSSRHPL